jgi:hypothetical protein
MKKWFSKLFDGIVSLAKTALHGAVAALTGILVGRFFSPMGAA